MLSRWMAIRPYASGRFNVFENLHDVSSGMMRAASAIPRGTLTKDIESLSLEKKTLIFNPIEI
jgi:hypothetical protein